jgi:hypothetical protein
VIRATVEIDMLLMLCAVARCYEVPAARGDRADERADPDN